MAWHRRLGTVLLTVLLCSLSQGAVAAPVPTAAGASTSSPIDVHYNQLGGATGLLGAQTRAETALTDGSYSGARGSGFTVRRPSRASGTVEPQAVSPVTSCETASRRSPVNLAVHPPAPEALVVKEQIALESVATAKRPFTVTV